MTTNHYAPKQLGSSFGSIVRTNSSGGNDSNSSCVSFAAIDYDLEFKLEKANNKVLKSHSMNASKSSFENNRPIDRINSTRKEDGCRVMQLEREYIKEPKTIKNKASDVELSSNNSGNSQLKTVTESSITTTEFHSPAIINDRGQRKRQFKKHNNDAMPISGKSLLRESITASMTNTIDPMVTVVNEAAVQRQHRSVGRKLSKLAKERKAAKTLGIVMGVFIVCWLPFFVANIITALCGIDCIYEPQGIMSIVTWLGWLNSAMNPVIYACWSRDFRRAFRKVLCSWVEFVCPYGGLSVSKKLKLRKDNSHSSHHHGGSSSTNGGTNMTIGSKLTANNSSVHQKFQTAHQRMSPKLNNRNSSRFMFQNSTIDSSSSKNQENNNDYCPCNESNIESNNKDIGHSRANCENQSKKLPLSDVAHDINNNNDGGECIDVMKTDVIAATINRGDNTASCGIVCNDDIINKLKQCDACVIIPSLELAGTNYEREQLEIVHRIVSDKSNGVGHEHDELNDNATLLLKNHEREARNYRSDIGHGELISKRFFSRGGRAQSSSSVEAHRPDSATLFVVSHTSSSSPPPYRLSTQQGNQRTNTHLIGALECPISRNHVDSTTTSNGGITINSRREPSSSTAMCHIVSIKTAASIVATDPIDGPHKAGEREQVFSTHNKCYESLLSSSLSATKTTITTDNNKNASSYRENNDHGITISIEGRKNKDVGALVQCNDHRKHGTFVITNNNKEVIETTKQPPRDHATCDNNYKKNVENMCEQQRRQRQQQREHEDTLGRHLYSHLNERLDNNRPDDNNDDDTERNGKKKLEEGKLQNVISLENSCDVVVGTEEPEHHHHVEVGCLLDNSNKSCCDVCYANCGKLGIGSNVCPLSRKLELINDTTIKFDQNFCADDYLERTCSATTDNKNILQQQPFTFNVIMKTTTKQPKEPSLQTMATMMTETNNGDTTSVATTAADNRSFEENTTNFFGSILPVSSFEIGNKDINNNGATQQLSTNTDGTTTLQLISVSTQANIDMVANNSSDDNSSSSSRSRCSGSSDGTNKISLHAATIGGPSDKHKQVYEELRRRRRQRRKHYHLHQHLENCPYSSSRWVGIVSGEIAVEKGLPIRPI